MTPQTASLHILGTQPKLRPWPGLCLPLARVWGSQPRRPRTSLLHAVLGTVWLEGATPRPARKLCDLGKSPYLSDGSRPKGRAVLPAGLGSHPRTLSPGSALTLLAV